jgi:hypothetical protein
MPEPTSTAVATIAAQAAAVPVLTLFGMGLGLRADILLAGFAGAVAGITLLNSVPAVDDSLHELLRTSLKRVGVSVGSAVFAGYAAPLVGLINGIPSSMVLGVAFIAGAGAMKLLPRLIDRFGDGRPKEPSDQAQEVER